MHLGAYIVKIFSRVTRYSVAHAEKEGFGSCRAPFETDSNNLNAFSPIRFGSVGRETRFRKSSASDQRGALCVKSQIERAVGGRRPNPAAPPPCPACGATRQEPLQLPKLRKAKTTGR